MIHAKILPLIILLACFSANAEEQGDASQDKGAKIVLIGSNFAAPLNLSERSGLKSAIERLLSSDGAYWYSVGAKNPRSVAGTVPKSSVANFLEVARGSYLHVSWARPFKVNNGDQEIVLSEAVCRLVKDGTDKYVPKGFYGVSSTGKLVIFDRCSGHILITEVMPRINQNSEQVGAPNPIPAAQ